MIDDKQTTIAHIEELAANAWPAEVVQVVDGWRLRFNRGVTRRANSVLPNNMDGRVALAERLALVEDWYARRSIPARYQICPAAQPTDLDTILAKRGYTDDAHTAVQIAEVATVQARLDAASTEPVALADAATEPWLETYGAADGFRAAALAERHAILRRIGPQTGYAVLWQGAVPVAVGLGVVERGWVGVFCMATLATQRRQGAATAVLAALAQWGQRHGATRMYLQVMEENSAALALYQRAGFTTLYQYHYRTHNLSDG